MSYEKLLILNWKANGIKSLFYSYGLSAWRLKEYTLIINMLYSEKPCFVVDIGSGYSIFPSYLKAEGFNVIVIDVNKKAMRWQSFNDNKSS